MKQTRTLLDDLNNDPEPDENKVRRLQDEYLESRWSRWPEIKRRIFDMYDIIVRFPNKKVADEFCGQMSDGFGENFCNFSFWRQKPGTTGKNKEDFERVVEGEKEVYFVNEIFEE